MNLLKDGWIWIEDKPGEVDADSFKNDQRLKCVGRAHKGFVIIELEAFRHQPVAAQRYKQTKWKRHKTDKRVKNGCQVETLAGLFGNTGQDKVSEGQGHHPQHHDGADDGGSSLHPAMGLVFPTAGQNEAGGEERGHE